MQGTVGVQLQADGSVQLMGEVALPDSVNLFHPLQVQKNLISISVDIPIVGVAVLGQRIGIFTTIQGGLDASAGRRRRARTSQPHRWHTAGVLAPAMAHRWGSAPAPNPTHGTPLGFPARYQDHAGQHSGQRQPS